MAGGAGRARAKSWAAEIDAMRRRAGFALPGRVANTAGRLRDQFGQWATSEVAPGRLVPWLPVAFGFGIALYFTAEHEPFLWAAGAAAVLADGRLVALALTADAFAEDCARATVVVSARDAPSDCAAVLVDRKIWRAGGAITPRWNGTAFEINHARPIGIERPWSQRLPQAASDASPPLRPAARDATPRADDLEIGD